MPANGGEISFDLQPRHHQLRSEQEGGLAGSGPLVFPLSIGEDVVLNVVISLILRGSFISEQALGDLKNRGLVPQDSGAGGRRLWLRGLRIAGHPVPDMEVRVSQLAVQLRVDGILGLNFLDHFAAIRYEIATRRVTLTNP